MGLIRLNRLIVASAVLLAWGTAWATVLITIEEALELAFPDATTERQTLFLSDEQRTAVAEESGAEVSSSLATRYVAKGPDGAVRGWAYLDTHRVRTLPETLMVVLDADGTVRRAEVVTFREPLEYMPREEWYAQYEGQELDDDLALKRDIRPVTGATLTARATTEAVRRVLALHEVASEGQGQ
jgi:Na+-translocating ferredoxin:NAD+ oxidoreductase RnfG subunit